MDIITLYDMLLADNVDIALYGELELLDECILWSYDGFGNATSEIEGHLDMTLDSDKTLLDDFINDNGLSNNFYLGLPEIEETTISLYIYIK